MTGLGLILAVATSVCSHDATSPGAWLDIKYQAVQVSQSLQSKTLSRLTTGILTPIDAAEAVEAAGDEALGPFKFHYAAKAGYIGGVGQSSGFVDPGLELDVGVDEYYVAYVLTDTLTHSHGEVEIAVILAGDVPLKGVVAWCSATE